ncbi:MAG: enoyl-CoA hydratase [Panacagrimonas sp.]
MNAEPASTPPQILCTQADGVLTIRFNRADKKNAFTQTMYRALAEGLNAGAQDSAVRAVLLTGGAEAFAAGNDLQDFMNTPPGTGDAPVILFMHALSSFPKPVIAAVNGVAVGVGVTMLLHCDLIYAGENARFQLPFVNLGICPEFASTYLLPRIMGHARAAELCLFGEPFSATIAREVGLVNELRPDAEVQDYALQRAKKLALQPPNAVRVAKRLLKRWTDRTIADAVPLEAFHFMPMLSQPEAKEAVGAFMQKRKPDFSRFR